MKRLVLAAAAASTVLFAAAAVNSTAQAMPIATSTAMQNAAGSLDPVQDIRYVCRHGRCWWTHRHWRHRGWRHRGWRHRGWRHRHWR